jgi:hypothetical protein
MVLHPNTRSGVLHAVEALAPEEVSEWSDTAPSGEELCGGLPDLDRSILNLDSIFVTDETVAVAGSVSSGFVLTSDLVINGNRVPIDAGGRFCAVVKLQGYWGLSLLLETGIHGTIALEVPLKAR